MNSSQDVKLALVKKYDEEAIELDNPAWLLANNDVLIPEPGAAHYFVKRKVEMALKLCGGKLKNDANVLEIGCSFGQMTALLAKVFSNLTAVDISPESVKIAEKRFRTYGLVNVRFTVDDAEVLSTIADESFDAVFAFSTLRFCPNPEKAMLAIKNKLGKNGILIIDFPNRKSPWHRFLKAVMGIKPHIHDRLYTATEAKELFEKAGFRVETIKTFLFTSRRLPKLFLPLFIVIDFILERLPFFSDYAGIIMIKGIKM